MRPLFSVAAVILSALTLSNCQVCELYSTSNLETLISGSITGEPNTVCLASGSRRDTYRDASVVVTVGGQLRQLDLSCSGSTWSLESNGSPTGGSLTTALRRDCNDCSATSNDPTFDNVTHCVGCSSFCSGLNQCTSFTTSGCCNFYDNDTCVRSCSAGKAADSSTNFTCIDPCLNNPCGNGGTCVANDVSFSCTCAGSWSGERCESCDIADCDSCSQTRDVCTQCRSGLDLLADGACACSLQCGSNRLLDSSLCQCNCSSGFAGQTCSLSCQVENCHSCSNSSLDSCNSCMEGFELADGGSTCSRTGTFIGPLSLGAFIGIIVAAVLVLVCVCMLVLCCCLCCKASNRNQVV